MCTLTYRLTDNGYELFFNRDEQRSRAQAIPPLNNLDLNAIYPIDPVGQGTWIAVHQSGLGLALLNYYQAEKKHSTGAFRSRGELIIKLLKEPIAVIEQLKSMSLHAYQAFQLCIFPSDLQLSNNRLLCFQWDGESLIEVEHSLPITSSGVDYPEVYQARKARFSQILTNEPSRDDLIAFHDSQQAEGKLSVKMAREDAKTVSFSHICVDDKVTFNYLDYADQRQHVAAINRR